MLIITVTLLTLLVLILQIHCQVPRTVYHVYLTTFILQASGRGRVTSVSPEDCSSHTRKPKLIYPVVVRCPQLFAIRACLRWNKFWEKGLACMHTAGHYWKSRPHLLLEQGSSIYCVQKAMLDYRLITSIQWIIIKHAPVWNVVHPNQACSWNKTTCENRCSVKCLGFSLFVLYDESSLGS